MRVKQIVSLSIAVLGVILILFAMNARGRVESAQMKADMITAPAASRPMGREMKSSADNRIGAYRSDVRWVLIGGVVLLIVGCGAFFVCRKPRH